MMSTRLDHETGHWRLSDTMGHFYRKWNQSNSKKIPNPTFVHPGTILGNPKMRPSKFPCSLKLTSCKDGIMVCGGLSILPIVIFPKNGPRNFPNCS